MELISEFYLHVTGGLAGDATALMARVALNIGHDAEAYPVDIAEIKALGELRRDPNTCGFNELLLADYLRSALCNGLRPWRPEQVQMLATMNGVPAPVQKKA